MYYDKWELETELHYQGFRPQTRFLSCRVVSTVQRWVALVRSGLTLRVRLGALYLCSSGLAAGPGKP